jgi:hypothetical protein
MMRLWQGNVPRLIQEGLAQEQAPVPMVAAAW